MDRKKVDRFKWIHRFQIDPKYLESLIRSSYGTGITRDVYVYNVHTTPKEIPLFPSYLLPRVIVTDECRQRAEQNWIAHISPKSTPSNVFIVLKRSPMLCTIALMYQSFRTDAFVGPL